MLTKYAVITGVCVISLGTSYLVGNHHGKSSQLLVQQGLQLQWNEQYQESQRVAFQQLQNTQADKQKWYDFAQHQSSKLAMANQQLTAQAELLKQEISNAIKNDDSNGVCFSGIGHDSLRIYQQALYPDAGH